jgi:hypothetical protein
VEKSEILHCRELNAGCPALRYTDCAIPTPKDYYSNKQVTKVANSFYNTFLLCLEKGSNNLKLLQEIRLSQKYKASAQEEEPAPSSSVGNARPQSIIYINVQKYTFFLSGHPDLNHSSLLY